MIQNLIIGAGPAGLAVAGCFSKHSIPYHIIDASDKIASSWHGHYDRLHLHTVKELSHLPYLDYPDDYPRYVSRKLFIQYLENYAVEFKIKPRLNLRVENISNKNVSWVIDCSENQFECKNLIIATGTNNIPHYPEWVSQVNTDKLTITHSRFYKNPTPFRDKKVLVVGMGNTGAEIALDLSEHNIETDISVRSPLCIVPRDLNGRPVQVTAKQLDKLPFGLGDWLGTQIRKIYFGNLSKYNIPVSKLPPVEQLRTTGKTPVVDIGTIKAIKTGKIKVQKDILKVSENSVEFKDGSTKKYDHIILATGYRTGIESFFPLAKSFIDKNNYPKNWKGDATLKNVYFTGFNNYKLGGVLGTVREEAMMIAEAVS